MTATAQSAIAVIGVDIGESSFHVVGSMVVAWCRSCLAGALLGMRREARAASRRKPGAFADSQYRRFASVHGGACIDAAQSG